MDRTFVFFKPNTIRRGLIGEILKRFEQRGLKIIAMKFHKMTHPQAESLYLEHHGKAFYESLIAFATGGPALFLIVEGPRCVELVRHVIGNTDPLKADPGTIRADYAVSVTKNLIHASDSMESFQREHKIFFSEEDIIDYTLDVQNDL
ncbi:MAG TPA: nucleoside-diphosphate kinase [Thermotogota bacterium]|nr:nucleoside-diphosphate kinase [Thermotogota bacterium]